MSDLWMSETSVQLNCSLKKILGNALLGITKFSSLGTKDRMTYGQYKIF